MPADRSDPSNLVARLTAVDGKRVAQGRDFDSLGQIKGANTLHLDETNARALAAALENTDFAVRSVESKPYRRSPYAPFRTTTLQQEASRKLGFGAKSTMQVAQKLYENGFITYMRTDSTTLSDTAITAARAQVTQLYGASYLPDKPRTYAGKVKNAQEAHEAIRPSGDRFRTPAETGLTGDQFRLYELIWKRTVASQMKDAVGNSVTVKIAGRASDGRDAEFSASGKTITFHGFLKAYVEGADDPNAELDDRERRLPQVEEGDPLTAEEISVDGHATKPPARYTEASLVKEPRRAGDRPPVDVRVDHRHDPRPRLCVQEGDGPRALLPVLRRGQPPGEALRAARRLRLHRQDGGRPRPHRAGRGPVHSVAEALLLR